MFFFQLVFVLFPLKFLESHKSLKQSFAVQSSLFVVLTKCCVNHPTRSSNSYPALQILTCYRVSPVTLSDFGGPDGGSISRLDCTNSNRSNHMGQTLTVLFLTLRHSCFQDDNVYFYFYSVLPQQSLLFTCFKVF